MRTSQVLCLAFSLLVPHVWAAPNVFHFVEGNFENRWRSIVEPDQIMPSDSRACTMTTSGNVGPYLGPLPPMATLETSAGTFVVVLAESSCGQMVASTAGAQGAVRSMLDLATQKLRESAEYGQIETLTGEVLKIGEGAWDIAFPNVLDITTGEPWSNGSTKPQNYYRELNLCAEAAARAALRIDPFNVEAARGILNCFHQRMVPLLFAANNGSIVASVKRLSADDPMSAEISILENNAIVFYEEAVQELVDLTARGPESGLLDGSDAYIPALALAEQVERLFVSYVRGLNQKSDALLRLYRLKYLNNYRRPVGGGNHPQKPLLTALDRDLRQLYHQFFAVNAFNFPLESRPPELDAVEHGIARLRQLRDSIADGRLSFVAGASDLNGLPAFSFREYPPEFVPFDARNSGFPDSFGTLLQDARDLADRSAIADTQALAAKREFDSNLLVLRENLRSIAAQANRELGDLCGLVWDDNRDLIPDVIYCFLPPENRDLLPLYESGTSKGLIYEQWKTINQAELELEAANLDLQNVISSMRKKQEVADAIARGINNIATLILENGEKIAALDIQEGEARAVAARTIARLEAQSSVRRGIYGAIGSFVGGFLNPAAWAEAAPSVASGVDAAITGSSVGDVEAALAQRLAQIQAQKTRISAYERAQIQYQQRDELLLRTEEAMHALMLEAERLKLNVLLAEQRLDTSNRELRTFVSRIRFALQEYRSSIALELTNPLRNPDYRLIRDLVVREAEESFSFAQDAAYLAVKAAQYRVNGASQQTGINSLLDRVLSSRRGNQLVPRLRNARNEVDGLYRTQGAKPPAPEAYRMSVRHFLVQNNYVDVTNEVTGEFNITNSVFEIQPSGDTSDIAWWRFLNDHVVIDQNTGIRRLQFYFSTSLACLSCDGRTDTLGNNNPLFDAELFNVLLDYGEQSYAVQVNFRGRNLGLPDPQSDLIVTLRQEGASYVRSAPFDVDRLAMNVWNLQPVTARIQSSINGFIDKGAPQLHERSPANDRWRFELRGGTRNADSILNNLDKLIDIELRFHIAGFQSQL